MILGKTRVYDVILPSSMGARQFLKQASEPTTKAFIFFFLIGFHAAEEALHTLHTVKGIVSRDFEWLQTILMNRSWFPDVPLKDYIFSNSCFQTFHKEY